MALKEIMKYAIELGFDGKDAERDSKKTFDSIGDNAEDSAGKFEGIGGKMGKALVAGFGALGVGALLMQGIDSAMDAKAGVRRLQGQFAFTAEEAQKYGDIAGDLYSEGWGDGLDEVQQAVGAAAKKLGATTDAELKGITTSVLAVTRTWGEDFDAVIRSTDQLIQNGLAPNAQAALDLIVTAFQNGGNEAGDLLDTIDEYSQHWAAMGLSGEDALNQIIHGFQNGQRDADKLGDAVKEMRLRVVEDTEAIDAAYASLGLNADVMRLKFLEGGDSAREAFQTVIGAIESVEDPIKRNSLAIELIGTQLEDLGPNGLESLQSISGAMDHAAGSAERLNETVESTEWEIFQRRGETALAALGESLATGLNALLEDLARNTDDAYDSNVAFAASIEGAERAARDFDMALLDNVSSFEDAHAAALEHAESLGLDADAALFVANVVATKWKDALDESAAAEAEATRQALLHSEAQRDQAKAANNTTTILGKNATSLEDVGDDAEEAAERLQELKDAFAGLRGEISDRSAYRDVQDSFDKIDEATRRADEALDEYGEGSVEAISAQRDLDQAIDDARLEVLDYAEALGDVPPEVMSRVQVLIDQGRFDEAEEMLSRLARNRDAVVRARVQIQQGTYASGSLVVRQDGSTVKRGATGGIVNRRTDNITLGEAGPEAVIPLDRSPGNGPLGGLGLGGGGTTINLTVNAGTLASGPEVGRRVVDALESYYRSGGRPPRSQS